MKKKSYKNNFKKAYNLLNVETVDRYGLGKQIRKYGFYPSFLPITITGEHGVSLRAKLDVYALEVKSPFYFFVSKHKRLLNFKNKTPIRHPSPFVWYRKKNKIYPNKNAKGSVFFLAHSTGLVKAKFDFLELNENLKKISDDFFPISFCLHFNDTHGHLPQIIENLGYRWFCLTSNYKENQIEKFYTEITNYKYALANYFTSALLYTIEMGIPTSILKSDDVQYINKGNKLYPLGIIKSDFELDCFNEVRKDITKEQKKFANEMLSLDLLGNLSNRILVGFCLYSSFFISFNKYFFQKLRQKLRLFTRIKAFING